MCDLDLVELLFVLSLPRRLEGICQSSLCVVRVGKTRLREDKITFTVSLHRAGKRIEEVAHLTDINLWSVERWTREERHFISLLFISSSLSLSLDSSPHEIL